MTPLRNCLDTDLVCFSHLRWDFVFQRPQHLLSRFAQHRRVFVVEEPFFDSDEARLDLRRTAEDVTVVVPHLPPGTSEGDAISQQCDLLEDLFALLHIEDATFWYYTPMAVPISRHLPARRVIYDCMDELSAFANAPAALLAREDELFARADHVFTGGQTLFEAKASRHHSVHAFPSSIDADHFHTARGNLLEPADMHGLHGLRLGFYGVIDERADLALIDFIAQARPEWQIILVGPVMKIDENKLPRHANIHYLGEKSYRELPSYLAHWDVAMLPFALNDSTRFISPTKTPEYLAAGKPVVSTAIRDVVHPYGDEQLALIADTPTEFVRAVEQAVLQGKDASWLARVDRFLNGMSWDSTWAEMAQVEQRSRGKQNATALSAIAAAA